ncbi:MAG: ribose 5-phosphate isomerase B [Desulfotalea sp.]
MKIVIASDHGGFELKKMVIDQINLLGHDVVNMGCDDHNSVDYPDYAEKAIEQLRSDGDLCILICGTGIGMSIVANRHRFVRAALCHDVFTAEMSREHNDANVLCLGARVLETSLVLDMVKIWLKTKFAGGRHLERITKFSDL